jgi:hypothetical protein
MPIYVCEHCDYETKHQGTMMRHLNKKQPCSLERVRVNMEIMKLIRSEGLMLLKLERDSEINIKELM